MQKRSGDIVYQRRLETIRGASITIPGDGDRWTHLQFLRLAGCPVCNLHLRSFAERAEEVVAAGIHEVALFHSEPETMRTFQGDLPFDVVADLEKALYREFGVQESLLAVVHPGAWLAMVKGSGRAVPSSATVGEGGQLGLPADFLVAPDGRIALCKHGRHADDQWSMDELLALAERARAGG